MNTALNRGLVQYSPEMESIDTFAGELPTAVAQRFAPNAETFNEGLVMEFAAELLEASSDTAFAETLGRLISRAGQAASRALDLSTTQALQAKLLRLAKNALPFAGRALGTLPAAPSSMPPAAATPAANPMARAAQAFGLELEGLSPEDKEFELTKSFVRLAVDAVRHAASLPDSLPPQRVATRAATEAARHWAPALLRNGAARRNSFQVPNSERAGVRNFNAVTYRKEPTMHDIDRTQLEYSNEQFEFGESEWSPEGGTFSESEQMELATELLSVSNEGEFDRFLGDLVGRATKAVGNFARSSAGQAVGGVLKGVAKKALPLAGSAIGSYFGGPLGAKIGSGIANAASSALGLEGEMAGEDREFEGAKQFVKIAGQTAATAAAAPPGSNPRAVAQQAAMTAAMQHAPGLLAGGATSPAAPPTAGSATGGARSGRWLRRGTKIVLYGV